MAIVWNGPRLRKVPLLGLWFFFLLSPVGAFGQGAPSTDAAVKALPTPRGDRTLTLVIDGARIPVSIDELQQLAKVRPVKVYDPDFSGWREYSALPLRELLTGILADGNKDNISELSTVLQQWAEVTFVCADGYRVTVAPAVLTIPQAEPFLAIGSLSHTPAQDSLSTQGDEPRRWEPYRQGDQWITFDPFYLIWQGPQTAGTPQSQWHAQAARYPWPYQLTEIVFSSMEQLAQLRSDDPNLEAGYELFREHCLRCHQLQGMGGDLGPDLMRANGMLDVLDNPTLVALIVDIQSFYPNSRMPVFADVITPQSAAHIVDYLKYMKTSR